MVPSKSVTQIRIDELAYEKLKIIASKELRSLNAQMEYFLINAVAEYESKNGEIIIPDEN